MPQQLIQNKAGWLTKSCGNLEDQQRGTEDEPRWHVGMVAGVKMKKVIERVLAGLKTDSIVWKR